MLSRVAEAVYWMNRYIERAENVARFVDVNLTLTMELPEQMGQWSPVVKTTGEEEAFLKRYPDTTRADVLHFLTFDEQNPNSILSCWANARENARSVREMISSAMWEHVNRSYLMVREAQRHGPDLADAHDLFARVKVASQLYVGITDGTMSHGEAWQFARLGRFLERADQTSRILDVKYFILLPSTREVGSSLDDLQWGAVLRSATALEMYRKKRRRRITPWDVADFLVLDDEFPRSIRYCVRRAEGSLHAITGTPSGAFRNEAEKRLGRLRGELDFVDIDDVFHEGLHEFLQRVQARLADVGGGVQETFFALRPVERPGALAAGQ